MAYKISYYNYRHDLSGSLTKNRYRYELYWGIEKVYELYSKNMDFHVVFDFASDIDVIINGEYEFYQLKTKNTDITLNYLTKLSKNKNSIISKLANLDKSQVVKKLAVVSNAELKCKNNLTRKQEKIFFSDLDESEQKQVKEHLKVLNKQDYDLSKYKYIRTNMPISETDNYLLGITSTFLQDTIGRKMIDPVYFRNYLQQLVLKMATYEHYPKSFDDTMQKKSISRRNINALIEDYKAAYHPEAEKITESIKRFTKDKPFFKEIEIKKSLNNLQKLGSNSIFVKNNVKKIVEEIRSNSIYSKLKFIDATEKLLLNVNFINVIEESDKICLIFMAYNELEGDS